MQFVIITIIVVTIIYLFYKKYKLQQISNHQIHQETPHEKVLPVPRETVSLPENIKPSKNVRLTYLDNLEKLFENLKSDVNSLDNPIEVSKELSQNLVMDFLKDKISSGLKEDIVIMYPKLKVYKDNPTKKASPKKEPSELYIANFTIYNVKRRSSVDVKSTVILADGQFKIKNILFNSKKEKKNMGIIPKSGTEYGVVDKNKITWIFEGTIENDGSGIEGGIPPGIAEKLL